MHSWLFANAHPEGFDTLCVHVCAEAKEQQGKVEHHAQLFRLMLEDVLDEVQPQTEFWVGECLDTRQEAKNNLLSVSGVSPMQLVFGRSPDHD